MSDDAARSRPTGSSASCCALLKRWTSSRNRIVPCSCSPSRRWARSSDLADVLHAGAHRGQLLERLARSCAAMSRASVVLPGARRAPQDHRRQPVGLDQRAQRLARRRAGAPGRRRRRAGSGRSRAASGARRGQPLRRPRRRTGRRPSATAQATCVGSTSWPRRRPRRRDAIGGDRHRPSLIDLGRWRRRRGRAALRRGSIAVARRRVDATTTQAADGRRPPSARRAAGRRAARPRRRELAMRPSPARRDRRRAAPPAAPQCSRPATAADGDAVDRDRRSASPTPPRGTDLRRDLRCRHRASPRDLAPLAP